MTSLAIAVAAGGLITYFVGLWDRPKFTLSTLLSDSASKEPWFAIVAICREKNISKHIMKIIEGTKLGIKSLENGKELLQEGCKAYLEQKQDSMDSLCVGLFLDDPGQVEHPRWAIGWAVRGSGLSMDSPKVQTWIATVQEKSGLRLEANPIRIVRLPGSLPVLRASIPWRSTVTPAVAPMLHWKRVCKEYDLAGCKSSGEGPICMEIYVMNEKKWFASYIDYTLVHGENKEIWKDLFP